MTRRDHVVHSVGDLELLISKYKCKFFYLNFLSYHGQKAYFKCLEKDGNLNICKFLDNWVNVICWWRWWDLIESSRTAETLWLDCHFQEWISTVFVDAYSDIIVLFLAKQHFLLSWGYKWLKLYNDVLHYCDYSLHPALQNTKTSHFSASNSKYLHCEISAFWPTHNILNDTYTQYWGSTLVKHPFFQSLWIHFFIPLQHVCVGNSCLHS